MKDVLFISASNQVAVPMKRVSHFALTPSGDKVELTMHYISGSTDANISLGEFASAAAAKAYLEELWDSAQNQDGRIVDI